MGLCLMCLLNSNVQDEVLPEVGRKKLPKAKWPLGAIKHGYYICLMQTTDTLHLHYTGPSVELQGEMCFPRACTQNQP